MLVAGVDSRAAASDLLRPGAVADSRAARCAMTPSAGLKGVHREEIRAVARRQVLVRTTGAQWSAVTSPAVADRRPLGRTGLSVSPVCLGTSPLASMPELYGYEVDSRRAEATVAAALNGPFNFIDTSNNYGGGSAEERIGRALAAVSGLP